MKFAVRYKEFMKGQKEQVPVVQLNTLEAVLQSCEIKDLLPSLKHRNPDGLCDCPQDCPVCDGTFFPCLLKDISVIVQFFNKRAKKLLESHLAAFGIKKYILSLKTKFSPGINSHGHVNMIKEAQDLVAYATITAFAIQKILNKYDKVHCSKKGHKFKLEAQSMHLELLKSPWLLELMAFHINLRENEDTKIVCFVDCLLHIDEDRPLLLVTLFDSIKLNLDLTCPICLDTVFDPVSLSCNHIFCHMCACSAASVTIVDGLKAAHSNNKCPLCRQVGVFHGAVHLDQLSKLLSGSMPEYWKERLQRERQERMKQAKEHWESKCRAFVGYE